MLFKFIPVGALIFKEFPIDDIVLSFILINPVSICVLDITILLVPVVIVNASTNEKSLIVALIAMFPVS